jgi:uncharacterized protein with FMN-binding domain
MYTCNALGVIAEDNRTVKVSTFSTTATNGAVFKNATLDWGDTSTTNNTNVVGLTHQYLKDGTYTIAATAHFTVNGQDVTAGGPNCMQQITIKTPPPNTPVYTCDALGVTAADDRTVTINKFSTTATNGAVFKNAVVNWGDNSAALTNANIVGQTHQYSADGTYTISATAHFTVNGKDVTAGGMQCEQQVTFKQNTPPVVTPPTSTPPTTPPPATPGTPAATAPTTLVNTGAGSVVGLFGAATVAGTLAYRRLLSRRLMRD